MDFWELFRDQNDFWKDSGIFLSHSGLISYQNVIISMKIKNKENQQKIDILIYKFLLLSLLARPIGIAMLTWLCFRSNFNFFYRVWKIGQFPVLVFGPKSVSYERSRSIDRCILRDISARAFLQFPKIAPNVPKSKFGGKIKFRIFREHRLKNLIFFCNSKPCWV